MDIITEFHFIIINIFYFLLCSTLHPTLKPDLTSQRPPHHEQPMETTYPRRQKLILATCLVENFLFLFFPVSI